MLGRGYSESTDYSPHRQRYGLLVDVMVIWGFMKRFGASLGGNEGGRYKTTFSGCKKLRNPTERLEIGDKTQGRAHLVGMVSRNLLL